MGRTILVENFFPPGFFDQLVRIRTKSERVSFEFGTNWSKNPLFSCIFHIFFFSNIFWILSRGHRVICQKIQFKKRIIFTVLTYVSFTCASERHTSWLNYIQCDIFGKKNFLIFFFPVKKKKKKKKKKKS